MSKKLLELSKTALLILVVAAVFVAIGAAFTRAGAPGIINYQGRVQVNGQDFTGNGLFKFALVSGGGTVTYWSNDGTSTTGNEPASAISLAVNKGLYSVVLGDTTLTNMTMIPSTAFNNQDVRLRIWFNDGTNGSQVLSPDSKITSSGYAFVASVADTVADGGITTATIADGAVTAGKIAAFPKVRVRSSTTQQIPSANTGVALSFDTEDYNIGSLHSNTTNPTRLTCTSAGVYAIKGTVNLNFNANGFRGLSIVLNGTTGIAGVTLAPAPGSASITYECSTHYQLNTNDYVELIVIQNSGSTLTSLSDPTVPQFMMAKLP